MSTSKYNWFSKNPDFSNKFCPYCGRPFSTFGSLEKIKENTNKEHLIGRDFVPRHSFDNPKNINFIFRACSACNSRKAEYERQISSVSLLNSFSSHSADEQERIRQKAQNDYSGFLKGKKVIDSFSTHSVKVQTDFFNLKIGLRGNPQVEETVIANLAFMHMQGLLCFILHSDKCDDKELVHLYKRDFHYFASFPKDNWGNPSLEYLRKMTFSWNPLMIMSTANNNFKIYIKASEDIIFWLLEWNKYYRVCGFIGEKAKCLHILETIPEEKYKYWGKDTDGGEIFLRQLIPLKKGSPDFIFL